MAIQLSTYLFTVVLVTALLAGISYLSHVSYSKYNEGVNPRRVILPPATPRRFTSECGVITNLNGAIGCDVCKFFVGGLQLLIQQRKSEADIVKFATYVCKKLNIEDDRVCEDITFQFKDELIGVATNLVLSPEEACGILLGNSCGTAYNPEQLWNVSLPKTPKPPVIPHHLPKPGSPTIRLLHISDIHTDPLYTPGTAAVCGEPLCCRKDDGKPGPGQPAAGKWGDLHSCDASVILVQNLFEHLYSIRDQFDYVIFTGDLPPHNVWKQSREDQLSSLQVFTQLALKYLPGKKVYNTLGNHESAPVNSFPPNYITGNQSMSWLYTEVAKSWLNWLPGDTKQTIESGGYYTVKLGDKFRLISLNMNFCNNGNWWLLINTTDPNGQLQWLIETLQKAEDNQEKVHIIGHIFPGGGSCLKPWSWNYYKIVNRYESTIVGQFFGHSHADWFNMFYDDMNFTRPTSVLYIPGGVTTFTDLNPGFRIYTIDGFYNTSSWAVLDFENYYFNITDANMRDKPEWKLEYTAKAEYNMNSLFPRDWDNLIQRMKVNDTLFQLFHRHYSKLANLTRCTGSCKSDLLCDLRSGRSHDREHLCQDLYDMFPFS